MGLPRALEAHRTGDVKGALQQYRRAYEQEEASPLLYQNFGALLKQEGHNKSALQVYNKGLNLYPSHVGIRSNRANLLHASSPVSSIQDLLISLRLNIAAGKISKCDDLFRSLVAAYREVGQLLSALTAAQLALKLLGPKPLILGQLIVILDDLEQQKSISLDYDKSCIMNKIEEVIESCEPYQQAELLAALASHDMARGQLNLALQRFERGLASLIAYNPLDEVEMEKRQKIVHVNCWNFGCGLIKGQQLARGWQLYEHGLRVPASGPQRWQRSLQKPYPHNVVPVWRGENLSGKQILLLEEQAIGDVMMFLTLVPHLLNEAGVIHILVNERLATIYKRSFASYSNIYLWTHSDIKKSKLSPDILDFQCPLGSICQHRFTDIATYSQSNPTLIPNKERSSKLRSFYLSQGKHPVDKLIGVSWKGGGTPGRIRSKSINPDMFAYLLRPIPGVRFVSLQYGKFDKQIETWRNSGIDILYDSRIDALKNMDLWVDQVAACDAVVSVANTTIHGSGGLDIPTTCLLSQKCDWRWFDALEVTRSFWYPSVGIQRELPDDGWSRALSASRLWLENGFPRPSGPISTLL